MRFRIKTYYGRYAAQVFSERTGSWGWIGSPNGYATIQEARDYCVQYKQERETDIVEEFEL